MKQTGQPLLPPQRLAVAYAPSRVRGAFALLLEFDARLALLVAGASEQLIGQLKLAWWRDALRIDPLRRPKGEPLLARLSALHGEDVDAAMLRLVDAWELLLTGDGSNEALDGFAGARGAAIFGGYTEWIGSKADVRSLGKAWAVAELTGTPPMEALKNLRLFRDRQLRPLTILALSVCDVSGPRLLWHALTGR